MGGAKGQHKGFHLLVLYGEGLFRKAVPFQLCAVPAAPPPAEGMGRRAQPHIRPPGPVAPVVKGFEAGKGEVGNLIMHVARGGHLAAKQLVLLAAEFFRRLLVFPAFQHVHKAVVPLHAELVAGNVLRPQGYGLVDGGFPAGVRQVGKAEDKVQTQVLETGLPHQADSLQGAFRRVAAVHPSKERIVEGLDAQAHAVYTQRHKAFQVGETLLDNVVRIALQGEFRVRAPVAALFQGEEDAGKMGKGQHGWCAAPKVKGFEAVVHFRGPAADFLAHLPGVGLIQPLLRDFGVKVAVGAEALAERDVDVNHTT